MLNHKIVNEAMRKQIDNAAPRILRQAHLTTCVDRMLEVSGERMRLSVDEITPAAADLKKAMLRHPDLMASDVIPAETRIVYYASEKANAPLLIGFHSGGFLFGGAALNDSMWSALSDVLGVNVASVSYRKAPANKWRASLADAACAVADLLGHAGKLGFDPDHIYLFGCSAGGNLAAAVCELLAYAGMQSAGVVSDVLNAYSLILLYPLLDQQTEPSEKGQEWYGGPAAFLMNEQHVDLTEAGNPLVSPLFADDRVLEAFPRTLCMTAEMDALRHEGARFIKRLNALGVPAEHLTVNGVPHCFFELGFGRDRLTEFETDFIGPEGVKAFESGIITDAAQKALQYLNRFLNIK